MITGFRNKDLILLEDEIKACSTRQIIMTDDGSNGNKGLVTRRCSSVSTKAPITTWCWPWVPSS